MPIPYSSLSASGDQMTELATAIDDICAPLETFPEHAGLEEHVVVAGALRTSFNYCGEPLSATSKGQVTLLDSYEGCLADICLGDELVLVPGRNKPRNIADFELVAVTGSADGWAPEGVYGMTVHAPDGLSCDFDDLVKVKESSFFADAPANICLIYRGKVIAVAGALAQDEATLRVVQLQGLVSKSLSHKERMKSGLHSGFMWRETLLSAWSSVALQAGFVALEVQGGKNNRWNDPSRDEAVKLAMERGYDKVAKGLGMQLTAEGNWRKDLKMSDKS